MGFRIRIVLIIILALFFTGSTRYELHPYTFPVLDHFPPIKHRPEYFVSQEGVTLGRALFYDKILSGDTSMSCGSCHRQSFAFSDGNVRFTKGRDSADLMRNTPGLINLAWYDAFFWDGRAPSLETQVFEPVAAHNEMNLSWPSVVKRLNKNPDYREKFNMVFGTRKIDSMEVAIAIAQFERTLISYHSKYDKVLAGKAYFTLDERAGFVLMNDMVKTGCIHCHVTDGHALTTTGSFSNNGLDPALMISDYTDPGLGAVTHKFGDYGKFKIPSLRNVALTAPYMHDGRFSSLEEVLDFYSDGVHTSVNVDPKMEFASHHGVHLTQMEKLQIIAFLHTLTDSVFITDPEFSDPFISDGK